MPEQETIERAREDAREGKSPSTQAGEFVREEIHHIREGKHGAASTKQAIAIGLSKARRSGVKLGPPRGTVSARTKAQAARDSRKAESGSARTKPSHKRSRATSPRAQARRPQGGVACGALPSDQECCSKTGQHCTKRSAKKAVQTRKRSSR